MAFTVSMPRPADHVYHVVFRCEGLAGPTLDFKMPAWTPGYYGLFDFAKNVRNFRAEDGAGRPLAWERTTANAWRVAAGSSAVVTVTVRRPGRVELRGPILPRRGPGLHRPRERVHVRRRQDLAAGDGHDRPEPGLERDRHRSRCPSASAPHVYAAPDFDVLYDSPILMGNLEALPAFEIQGIRHEFIGYKPAVPEPAKFMRDLKAALEAGIAVTGDIPYRHYTFLAIGPGQGGIEHLNSTTFGFNGAGLTPGRGKSGC